MGIELTRGTQPMDLLERLVQHDPNNVTLHSIPRGAHMARVPLLSLLGEV